MNLPFLSRPQEEVVPVGNDSIGVLYLLKKGGITPNENPIDFQEQQKNQQRFLLRLNKRIKELAKEAGVPVSVMRKKVMGAEATEKMADSDEVVEADIDDGNQGIFDYLDEDTANLLFAMQEDKRNTAIKAATYMFAKRVAYPVKLRANAVQDSRTLPVETPLFFIPDQTDIKFGNQYVKTVSHYSPSPSAKDVLLKVEPLIDGMKQGEVGFLCDRESISLKVGYDDWDEQKTKDSLSEELIGELYRFYLEETGQAFEEQDESPDPRDEGNLLKDSKSLSDSPASTGENSSSDSSSSESMMNDSTTKTLETSQVG